jgi:hypothetical protein
VSLVFSFAFESGPSCCCRKKEQKPEVVENEGGGAVTGVIDL